MEQVALALIWAAAAAATLIVVLYAATARFWATSAGRALMTSKVALALLLDLSLLFHAHPFAPRTMMIVSLVVYALICVGAWLMFLELVRAQVLRRSGRR